MLLNKQQKPAELKPLSEKIAVALVVVSATYLTLRIVQGFLYFGQEVR